MLSVLPRYLGRLPAARGLTERDTVRGLSLSVWEGALYTVAVTLIGGPYLAGYALLMGAGPIGVALISAVPSLAGAVQVLAAPLIARAGRRVSVVAAGAAIHRIGWGLAGLLLIILPRHLWLGAYTAAVLLAHLGHAATVTAWYSLMSDLAQEEVRGRYFGLRNAVHGAVAIVTILAAGAVLDRFPGRTGFLLLHGGTILFGLVNVRALLAHPEPARPSRPPSLDRWAPLANPAFRLIAAFVGAWTFMQTLSAPFFSIVMLKHLALSYTTISWLMVTSALATVSALFLWGPLCDRLGEGRVISLLGPALASVPLGWLVALRGGPWLLFPLHAVQGAAAAGVGLALSNLNMTIAGNGEDQLTYLALFAAVGGLAGGLGPVVGGLVGRPAPVFLLAAGGSWLLWAAWWFWFKPHRVLRRAANRPQP